MASSLDIGATATASLTVEEADLASKISTDPDDKFPAVLATSRLVAIMEAAAARVLKPLLGPGQLSVGATIDMSHTAATPAGANVVAEATYVRSEGKVFVLEIVAKDEGGEIGRGVNKRAIVSTDRIEQGARKRVPGV